MLTSAGAAAGGGDGDDSGVGGKGGLGGGGIHSADPRKLEIGPVSCMPKWPFFWRNSFVILCVGHLPWAHLFVASRPSPSMGEWRPEGGNWTPGNLLIISIL